jgi:hypothetical protein
MDFRYETPIRDHWGYGEGNGMMEEAFPFYFLIFCFVFVSSPYCLSNF